MEGEPNCDQALLMIREEFLAIADDDERRFVESSEELPTILLFKGIFAREMLSLRFDLYDTLSGSLVSAEMEEHLYPQKELANDLLARVRRAFPQLNLKTLAGEFDRTFGVVDQDCPDIVLDEKVIRYQESDIDEKYARVELSANDFLLDDDELNEDQKKNDELVLPEDCSMKIIDALRRNEQTEAGQIALRTCQPMRSYLFANVINDLDNPVVEFSLQHHPVITRRNSKHYRRFVLANQENQQFCDIINNLSSATREKLIQYLFDRGELERIRRQLDSGILQGMFMMSHQMDADTLRRKVLDRSWHELLKRIREGTLHMETTEDAD